MESLSKANTSFSLALFKKLCDNDDTANIFYSPFSISSALAMVMLGAGGNTLAQMSEVLCFAEAQKPHPAVEQQMMQQQVVFTVPPFLQKCLETKESQDEVHTSFAQLLKKLNKEDASYALSVANRLYGEESFQFLKEFLEKTKTHYEAELETVDFQTDSENVRVNINRWVESQTKGKIRDLLAQGVVNSMTRLVLVNAIYFKGNWNKKFKENQTRDAHFKINMNETKTVKMMHQTSKFPYAHIKEANVEILEMPYKGKELSMFIFLPNSTTGFKQLESQLTYENFMEWTRPDMMDEIEVKVGLPKFKMEEQYDLENVLMSMGMVDAFDMGMSDFSCMSPNNDLVLSKVVHKAFVEVNEEGTEAAAATAAVMMMRSARISPPPVNFIADHPFLFFIRHNQSGSILFAGRYCSPE